MQKQNTLKGTENTEIKNFRAFMCFTFPPVGLYHYLRMKKHNPKQAQIYGLLGLTGLGMSLIGTVVQSIITKK
jgi:hypothetical protein